MKYAMMLLSILVLAVVVGMIVSLPVMWLWNGCLVGAVAGVHSITWLQAWGLNILAGFMIRTSVTTN